MIPSPITALVTVSELKLPLSTTGLGALGYSLGGAAALSSLLRNNGRLASGLNLDGTLLGEPAANSSAADVQKPAFLLGSEGHGSSDGPDDYTWMSFPRWQTAYERKMSVNGTTHHDFFDDTFWKTVEPGADQHAGPIDGEEMVRLLNSYVRAFFDLTLRGRSSPILDGPSSEFPEVVYYNVSGAS
ncbi:hypothetical protein GGR52DRAFT_561348 [Hypoxylon sp. FL1284]|nr:hypothetical protein GGR52DRAFT_561348 [Hypoxylon sp. FL1284]